LDTVLKASGCPLGLETVSTIVHVAFTPTVGGVVQSSVCLTVKGAEGAVTVMEADARSPSGLYPGGTEAESDAPAAMSERTRNPTQNTVMVALAVTGAALVAVTVAVLL
jgi:hypothetical protein